VIGRTLKICPHYEAAKIALKRLDRIVSKLKSLGRDFPQPKAELDLLDPHNDTLAPIGQSPANHRAKMLGADL